MKIIRMFSGNRSMLFRVFGVALFVLLPLLSACSKGEVKPQATPGAGRQDTAQTPRPSPSTPPAQTVKPPPAAQPTQEARKTATPPTPTSTPRPVSTPVPTPTRTAGVPELTVKITPDNITLLPQKENLHFTATVAGHPSAVVDWKAQIWGAQGSTPHGGLVNLRNDGADFKVPETPGIYQIVATATAYQSRAIAVATVKVDPGVWVLTSRQAKSLTNPPRASSPRLEVTTANVSGGATIAYGGQIPGSSSSERHPSLTGKWTCTWPEPPRQMEAGDKFGGTLRVEGTVSITNPPYNGYKWSSGSYGDVAVYLPIGGADITGKPAASIRTSGDSMLLPWSWTQSSSASFQMTWKARPSKGAKLPPFQVTCSASGVPGYSSLGESVEYVYEARLSGDPAVQRPAVEPERLPAGLVDSGARFSGLNGQVEWSPNGKEGSWEGARPNTVLPVGAHIRTQEGGSAVLSFADYSTYVLREESEVVLVDWTKNQSQISLISGDVWANIKKMLTTGSMEIEMGTYIASVKGTTLVMGHKKDESTLKVIEGQVLLKSKGNAQTALVNAGQTVTATRAGIGPVKTFDAIAEQQAWDKLRGKAADTKGAGGK